MGFLFGKSKIQGDERHKCLAYLEEQWKIQSFQKKESDLYDNSVIKFSSSSVAESHVVREMCRAANRFVQSVNESFRRHRSIQPVPDIAFKAWHAWELRYSDYLAFATAQAAIAKALVSDRASAETQLERLGKLTLERDKSLHKVIGETMKLMQRLQLTNIEHTRLLQVAEDAQKENWQPNEPKEN